MTPPQQTKSPVAKLKVIKKEAGSEGVVYTREGLVYTRNEIIEDLSSGRKTLDKCSAETGISTEELTKWLYDDLKFKGVIPNDDLKPKAIVPVVKKPGMMVA